MLNIKKILLPVDFPNPSLRVIHQAATLARHFKSEIVMLHVANTLSHTAGVPKGGADLAGWDMHAEVIRHAEKSLDQALGPKLDGITIRRVLVKGDAAHAILQIAEKEKADLIMMPSHGHTFYQFLLGSVAAKALHGTGCRVWTDAHAEDSPAQDLAIRNVLCAVDFTRYDRKTVAWAARVAAEFGARLTLAHVTTGVESWGPGGDYVNQKWKKALVENAAQQIAELQQDAGIKADVFIGSGDMSKVLSQAVAQTKADLLVNGCNPYGGRLRTHGFAVISAVPIPVLSV